MREWATLCFCMHAASVQHSIVDLIMTASTVCPCVRSFFATQPLVPANPLFDYKTRTCEVTKFAANFVTSTGHR